MRSWYLSSVFYPFTITILEVTNYIASSLSIYPHLVRRHILLVIWSLRSGEFCCGCFSNFSLIVWFLVHQSSTRCITNVILSHWFLSRVKVDIITTFLILMVSFICSRLWLPEMIDFVQWRWFNLILVRDRNCTHALSIGYSTQLWLIDSPSFSHLSNFLNFKHL